MHMKKFIIESSKLHLPTELHASTYTTGELAQLCSIHVLELEAGNHEDNS